MGVLISFAFLHLTGLIGLSIAAESRPNILIFLVDDLGFADLGCYGNDSLKTPNIDRLASEGAQLMHHYSPESMCTPSRAAFLTGRYAIRSGLATGEKGSLRIFLHSATSGGLPQNETTFGKALQANGYSTGLIGKWHLGVNCESGSDFCHHPNRHGFDHFYGLPLTNLRECSIDQFELTISHFIPHLKLIVNVCISASAGLVILILLCGNISRFRPWLIAALVVLIVVLLTFYCYVFVTRRSACFLMRQTDVVEQPIQLKDLTQRLTSEAVWFLKNIQSMTAEKKPFLLMMSFAKVHTALFTTDAFKGHSGHSKYGDNVEEMDWSVGVILKALKELQLEDSTLVYFTSDHGPHLEEVFEGEYQGGWKGNLKGGKGQSWEGGIRVPGIARWPNMIPAGSKLKQPSTSLDVFATILTAANAKISNDRLYDSRDMMPYLKGNDVSTHRLLPHYCGTSIHAVTYTPHPDEIWKVYYFTPKWTEGTQACFGHGICQCHGDYVTKHDPPLLFSLKQDEGEDHPLKSTSEKYKQVLKEVTVQLQEFVKTVDNVPRQADSHFFLPWLQPGCNFPFYTCKETYPHKLVDLPPI